MPKDYEACKQSELNSGKKLADAKRICAIRFYKVHGKTPMQAEKEASIETTFDDDEVQLFELIDVIAPIITGK
jgi:hypothetical protein